MEPKNYQYSGGEHIIKVTKTQLGKNLINQNGTKAKQNDINQSQKPERDQ